ncbi:MAG: N-6 DNA methylase [Chloroflexi bacterium]|nr:N-6 DNA methylase [Chloroflexota bacterium]
MDLEQFGQAWKEYLGKLAGCGSHTAIEVEFLRFIETAFGIPLSNEEYQFEKRVYRGRIDALLGNLVLEFKKDFLRERGEAEEELHKYFKDLKGKHPSAIFTGVATDGARFQVYDQNVKPLSEMKDLRRARPEEVLSFLDSLFFTFRSLQTPTTANIVASLGPQSPTFITSQQNLAALFAEVREEPAVQVRFNSWRRYLQRVYGDDVGDEALFLKHTYLSVVAKFIAFFFRYRVVLPDAKDIEEVLTGVRFSQEGIRNFIDDDFFTWPLNEKIKARGTSLVQKLSASLTPYDFSVARQDILKELYEEILGKEARHSLGEYYTPDWLAEYTLREMAKLQENPDWRVMDPACGSGTFLFTAIQLLRDTLENLGKPDVLGRILDQVVGMDVHPVAVTIARTNYLLALGDLLQSLPEPISLPVYLADSLRPPKLTELLHGNGETIYAVEVDKNVSFSVPASAGPHLDELVEAMRGFLDTPLPQALSAYQKRIGELQPQIGDHARQALVDNLQTLLKLYAEGKDTVWLFILKNMPRPRFMAQGFDLLAGNPPWLSLRYIADSGYSKEVKNLVLWEYHILGPKKAHLFTHIDLAPLFFVQASFLYLKKGGHVAFVMPRGVLSADQYSDFTSFEFIGQQAVRFALEQVVDLAPAPKEREVTPLFRQAACVLMAEKGGQTKWPVPAVEMEGKLTAKNLKWPDAQKQLKLTAVKLNRVDGRLLTEGKRHRPQGKSYYYDKVFEGATLVPRNLFFVRAAAQPGPLSAPNLVTDEEEARLAKPPWRDIRMKGAIEAPFIFATLLGGDILPFGHAPQRPVVLPLIVEESKPVLVNYNTAVEQGRTWLAAWLKTAEAHWQKHAKKDANGEAKIPTLLEQINYRKKLTVQSVKSGHKVVYNAAGTHVAACSLNLEELGAVDMGSGMRVRPQGFIVDYMNFYCETESSDEARYLVAMLNSPVLNRAIKPLQARGLFGERHVQRKPFLFSIPQYNPKLASHRKLAELSTQCHEKVAQVLPELLGKYKGSGPLRSRIREMLAEELKTIDWHVTRLLKVPSPTEDVGGHDE